MLLELLGSIFSSDTSTYMIYSDNEFEKKVSVLLSNLDASEYIVINDILIRTNKRSIQIDHIVLSKFGIFIIESKDYKGIIYGNKNSNYFTQYLGNNKYKFYNPINQNYSHIKIISDIFEIPKNCFISIVCFSNKAKLKVNDKGVISYDYLLEKILMYDKVIFEGDIDKIAKKLKAFNVHDYYERKEHNRDVEEKKYQNAIKINNDICPRCGGKLILRKGKYGEFYGCSNYPKCHFIK